MSVTQLQHSQLLNRNCSHSVSTSCASSIKSQLDDENSDILLLKSFIKVNKQTKSIDASSVISKECFQCWLTSLNYVPQHPEEEFRNILVSHVTGNNDCVPFDVDEETAILKVLRQKQIWPCFETDCPKVKIGLHGFRSYGFHEKQRLNRCQSVSPPPLKRTKSSRTKFVDQHYICKSSTETPPTITRQRSAPNLLQVTGLSRSKRKAASLRNSYATFEKEENSGFLDLYHETIQNSKTKSKFDLEKQKSNRIRSKSLRYSKLTKQKSNLRKSMKIGGEKTEKPKSKFLSSYEVFVLFAGADCDGNSKILSKECFKTWVSTRRNGVKNAEHSFRKALIAHLCGKDGRRPFPKELEPLVVAEIRKKRIWPCFEGNEDPRILNIGNKGFRHLAFHEGKEVDTEETPDQNVQSDLSSPRNSQQSSANSLKKEIKSSKKKRKSKKQNSKPKIKNVTQKQNVKKSTKSEGEEENDDDLGFHKPLQYCFSQPSLSFFNETKTLTSNFANYADPFERDVNLGFEDNVSDNVFIQNYPTNFQSQSQISQGNEWFSSESVLKRRKTMSNLFPDRSYRLRKQQSQMKHNGGDPYDELLHIFERTKTEDEYREVPSSSSSSYTVESVFEFDDDLDFKDGTCDISRLADFASFLDDEQTPMNPSVFEKNSYSEIDNFRTRNFLNSVLENFQQVTENEVNKVVQLKHNCRDLFERYFEAVLCKRGINLKPATDICGDVKLLRILRSCDGDVSKAEARMEAFLKWREENDVDLIREKLLEENPSFEEIQKRFLIGKRGGCHPFFSQDSEGNFIDIWVLKPQTTDDGEQCKQFLENHIVLNEFRSLVLDRLSYAQNRVVGYRVLLDCSIVQQNYKGIKRPEKAFSNWLAAFKVFNGYIRELCELCHSWYGGSCNKVHVLGSGYMFKVLSNSVVKTCMNRIFGANEFISISELPENNSNVFTEVLGDREKWPTYYGGSCADPFGHGPAKTKLLQFGTVQRNGILSN